MSEQKEERRLKENLHEDKLCEAVCKALHQLHLRKISVWEEGCFSTSLVVM